MLEQIKERLGANFIENTENVLKDLIEDMTSIAIQTSNRNKDDEMLFPYIKKAVISEYNARGAEGLLSRNEGSVSSSFNDIENKLRTDLIQIRRIK